LDRVGTLLGRDGREVAREADRAARRDVHGALAAGVARGFEDVARPFDVQREEVLALRARPASDPLALPRELRGGAPAHAAGGVDDEAAAGRRGAHGVGLEHGAIYVTDRSVRK